MVSLRKVPSTTAKLRRPKFLVKNGLRLGKFTLWYRLFQNRGRFQPHSEVIESINPLEGQKPKD